MNLKDIPIGIENFNQIENKYYVDKTLIIKDIIDQGIGKSILITRPRRFGKSLALSTIDYFFNQEKNDYSYLFDDKLISNAGDNYLKYKNQYPLIHLNLKTLENTNEYDVLDKIKDKMSALYKEYSYLLKSDSLFEIDKKEIDSIINKKASYSLLSSSLKNLTYYLKQHFNKNVILLIDEYDAPLQSSFLTNNLDKYLPFFRSFYSDALKGNENLEFAIITGVVQISKESLFSGLNNLFVCSVDQKFLSSYFGFTKNEVIDLLKYYNIDINFDKLKEEYGGYNLVNDLELLNPWSVLNFVQSGCLFPYWANTGTNQLVYELINQDESFEEILSSLNNKDIKARFTTTFTYRDKTNINIILSLLVGLGYLTIVKSDEQGFYNFYIPNKEIREIFYTEILSRNIDSKHINSALKFVEAVKNSNVEEIKNMLETYLLPSLSYYDLKDERNYHNAITGALAFLFDSHIISNEVNTGNGRCDIMLTPKDINDIGIIIEIKHSKAKTEMSYQKLKQLADNAIEQIENKKYVEKLKQLGVKKIYLYGMSFKDKKSAISSKIVTE